jgi:hypothetical protein
LLINSFVDATIIFSMIVLSFTLSNSVMKRVDLFYITIYVQYIGFYIKNALCLLSSLISIKIAIDRCLFLTRINYNQRENTIKLIIPIFVFMSFIFFIPYFLLIEIRESKINSQTIYYTAIINSIDEFYGKIIMFAIQFVPYITNIIIMISLNFILVTKFRKQILDKYSLIKFTLVSIEPTVLATTAGCSLDTIGKEVISSKMFCKIYFNKQKHTEKLARQHSDCRKLYDSAKNLETKITQLVIYISILFVAEQIIYGISTNLYTVTTNHTTYFKITIMTLHVIIVSFYSLNIFVYYKFDRAFATRFKLSFQKLVHRNSL